MERPTDYSLQANEKDLKQIYETLVNSELLLFRQKAKSEQLQKDDLNTKYFHAKVKEKNAKQCINSILTEQGEVINEEPEIAEAFLQYYHGLLGTSDAGLEPVDVSVIESGPVLNDMQKVDLLKPVTEAEVRDVVFSIDNTKSTRLDGFSSDFFKTAWHIVKTNLCRVQDFFAHGRLLKQVNATLITLVPMLKCPKAISDFRPISCCNVVYDTKVT